MTTTFHPREANLLVIDPGSLYTRAGLADYQNPPALTAISRISDKELAAELEAQEIAQREALLETQTASKELLLTEQTAQDTDATDMMVDSPSHAVVANTATTTVSPAAVADELRVNTRHDANESGKGSASDHASSAWVQPIQNGQVADWDALQVLWRKILVNHCGVERATNINPVLLTVPVSWSRSDQERATRILFEYINVPGMFLLDQPVAALYGAGVTSGLVVDIGHTTTDISPVFENVAVYSASVTIAVGGQDIETYLVQLMNGDEKFVASYGKYIGRDLARAFIQSPAFFAPSLSGIEQPNAEFDFKGQKIDIGSWGFRAIDVLFKPELIGKDVPGIHDAMHLVVSNSCEPEKRLFLWENILLVGGCSLIRGIKDRIESELAVLLAASETSSEYQAKDVKWIKLPDYFVEFKDRSCDAAFLGGSITAKLVFTSSGAMYLTRADYDEFGPAASFLKSG